MIPRLLELNKKNDTPDTATCTSEVLKVQRASVLSVYHTSVPCLYVTCSCIYVCLPMYVKSIWKEPRCDCGVAPVDT